MATYVARMMDSNTGSEGIYEFDGPDELFKETPVRIVRRFMEHVDKKLFPTQHVDYELNACFKNKEHAVVTAMGSLLMEHPHTELPFLMMIAPKKA